MNLIQTRRDAVMNPAFDKKEQMLLDHYCKKIAARVFDEYDIYPFLILVRSHFTVKEKRGYNGSTPKYKWLTEIGDLVAHRERDRGEIFAGITTVIKNGYMINSSGKTLLGYAGIQNGELEKELGGLFIELGHPITGPDIQEIIVCLFSILQGSKYVDKRSGFTGEVKVLIFNDTVALVTTSNILNKSEPLVYLATLKCALIQHPKPTPYFPAPIEVVREHGSLVIKCDGKVL